MAEAAIHLVDELLPLVPVRQFVITFPVQLRLWMARSKSLCAKVCEKVGAELTAHLKQAAGIDDVFCSCGTQTEVEMLLECHSCLDTDALNGSTHFVFSLGRN
jgi:hypothetical protein